MKSKHVADLCPCGCGEEVPKVTVLDDTPFISTEGKKKFVVSRECIARMGHAPLAITSNIITFPKTLPLSRAP